MAERDLRYQREQTLTVIAKASSTTREISAADFHFTPIAGKTLKTTDITITSLPEFQQWFTGSGSAASGGASLTLKPSQLAPMQTLLAALQ